MQPTWFMKEFHFGWKTGQFYDFCQEHLSYTTKKSESSENEMKKQHHNNYKVIQDFWLFVLPVLWVLNCEKNQNVINRKGSYHLSHVFW